MSNNRSDYNRQYWLKNKDRLSIKSKKYYLDNKEHYLDYHAKRHKRLKEEGIGWNKILKVKRKWRMRNPNKVRANRRRYRENNKETVASSRRKAHLKKFYRLTIAQYDLMFQAQGGCCAICGSASPGKTKYFHVDHNHVTGKIRGLLCMKCNLGLGSFNDNSSLLELAAKYLIARDQ